MANKWQVDKVKMKKQLFINLCYDNINRILLFSENLQAHLLKLKISQGSEN